MNYIETPTGLKLVVNTDPDAVGIVELMRAIFQLYVDNVLKNPFVSNAAKIESEIFHSRVDALVKSHPCYT
jgi:Sybindin-like family